MKIKQALPFFLLQIGVIAIWCCLSGCSTTNTVGHDFNISRTKQIVKGKTTASEIESLFGKPNSKYALKAGDESWN
jgi:hypothetical protein